MKVVAILLALTACAVRAEVEAGTPIQKVITLLGGMLEKAKAEMHDEKVEYAKSNQLCKDTIAEKTRLIAEAEDEMEQLEAKHTSEEAAANAAQDDATKAAETITTNEGEMAKAVAERKKEHETFVATQQDLMESVDALDRAIKTLNAQPKKVAQIQLSTLQTMKLIPQHAKDVVTAFLQGDKDPLALAQQKQTPPAHGYENQSGGVIDMLEDLKQKFQSELDEANTNEANAAHAHNMFMQDKTGEQTAQKAQKDHSLKLKAEAEQADAEAQAAHTATQAQRNADRDYMDNTKAECDKSTSEFTENQDLRAQELVAIQQAIDIMSGDPATGAKNQGLAFAQFASKGSNPTQLKAAQFLRQQAERFNSPTLSTLAVRVGDSPFASVIKMINELIARLNAEAAEEAEHKGWCDTELATNKATREEKSNQVIENTAKFDKATANVAKLTKEINEHDSAIAENQKALAEANEIRNEEKKTNEVTIQESKDAQTATAKAIDVLKAFYQKAGESKSYSSDNQGGSSSVIGMLEVIQSDFARLEADTETQEQSAVAQHAEFTTDNESNTAKHEAQKTEKTSAKATSEENATDATRDRKQAQSGLDKANQYYQKLRPTCVDAGMSHEERMQRRADEIQSLKEALEILSDHDSA